VTFRSGSTVLGTEPLVVSGGSAVATLPLQAV
jgi:hypothetical protein